MKTLLRLAAFCATVWAVSGLGGDAHGQDPPGRIHDPVNYTGRPAYSDEKPPKDKFPPSPELCKSVVRITGPGTLDGQPVIIEGSGTVVEVRGSECMVLSCGHVVRDANPDAEFTIQFANGQSVKAIKTLTDQTGADLSAFIVPTQPGIGPVRIAQGDPEVREVCTSMGYGQFNEPLAYFNGIFLRHCFAGDEKGQQHQELDIAGACRGGDSGGPIFNARWEMCGIIHCVDDSKNPRRISGPANGPLRSFLQRAMARWNGRQSQQKPQPQTRLTPVTPDPWRPRIEPVTRPQTQPQIVQADPGGRNTEAPSWNGGEINTPMPAQVDNSQAERPDAATIAEDTLKSVGTWGLKKALTGLGVAQGPAGWIAAAGMTFVWWRLRKKFKPGAANEQPVLATAVDEVENVGREVVRRFNRVVPYDSGKTDKAWADAHAILIERYPGYRHALQHAARIKDQLMNGLPIDQIQ